MAPLCCDKWNPFESSLDASMGSSTCLLICGLEMGSFILVSLFNIIASITPIFLLSYISRGSYICCILRWCEFKRMSKGSVLGL